MANAPDLPQHFCVLTDREYNFYVNMRGVADVITNVMQLCLEYGVPSDENGVKDVDREIGEFIQKEKEKHDAEVSNTKKKSTWYGKNSNNFFNKSYKDLDPTNLLEIIPRVTEIKENNPDVNYQILWKSIREIKKIRNDVMHINHSTYSEDTLTSISDKVNDIVDKLETNFHIDSNEVVSIKEKYKKKIEDIKDSQSANEDKIKCTIIQRVTEENVRNWAPVVMKSVEFDNLPFSDTELPIDGIFHAPDLEVLSNHNIPGARDPQQHQIFPCTDILSMMTGTNVDIIEGDPGSGKSTLLKMLCFEFCKESKGAIFKLIESYPMFMLINCRDKVNINSVEKYFEKHYRKISRDFPEKFVIAALRDMKMIIAIDGLDEANEVSTALVRDLIHHFADSKTARFLITTRPGFSKKVTEQLGKTIQYRLLNIKPINNFADQEKFICRVIKHIPKKFQIDVENIIKIFRAKHAELNPHFHHPLGLMTFITLFIYFHEKIDKLNHQHGLMQLIFNMHLENMAQRIPDAITNSSQCCRGVMEILGKISMLLIQNSTYEIDQETFDSLTDKCYEKYDHIPVESILSCVLLKRKGAKTTLTNIYDYFHHSQQEYFASKVLTNELVKTRSGTVLKVMQKLTGEDVQEADLTRLG